jgi:hypothetical protein
MTHVPKTGAALLLAFVLLAAAGGCQGTETAGGGTGTGSGTSSPAPVSTAAPPPSETAVPGGQASDGADAAAARAVEAYLLARVEANVDKMIALSCADWESEARKEAASLRGVKAKLDGLSCQAEGATGETALVACQGNIVATYNGEDRELSVARRKFKTVVDGGEWRMCGYE